MASRTQRPGGRPSGGNELEAPGGSTRSARHPGRTVVKALLLGGVVALAARPEVRNRLLDVLFGPEQQFEYDSLTEPVAAPIEGERGEERPAGAEPERGEEETLTRLAGDEVTRRAGDDVPDWSARSHSGWPAPAATEQAEPDAADQARVDDGSPPQSRWAREPAVEQEPWQPPADAPPAPGVEPGPEDSSRAADERTSTQETPPARVYETWSRFEDAPPLAPPQAPTPIYESWSRIAEPPDEPPTAAYEAPAPPQEPPTAAYEPPEAPIAGYEATPRPPETLHEPPTYEAPSYEAEGAPYATPADEAPSYEAEGAPYATPAYEAPAHEAEGTLHESPSLEASTHEAERGAGEASFSEASFSEASFSEASFSEAPSSEAPSFATPPSYEDANAGGEPTALASEAPVASFETEPAATGWPAGPREEAGTVDQASAAGEEPPVFGFPDPAPADPLATPAHEAWAPRQESAARAYGEPTPAYEEWSRLDDSTASSATPGAQADSATAQPGSAYADPPAQSYDTGVQEPAPMGYGTPPVEQPSPAVSDAESFTAVAPEHASEATQAEPEPPAAADEVPAPPPAASESAPDSPAPRAQEPAIGEADSPRNGWWLSRRRRGESQREPPVWD